MGLYDLLQPPFRFAKVILAVTLFAIVIVAITVHEFAHALSAKFFGDDTAESRGRLSLNPLKHYDPLGSTLFLLFGFGWAKPVPVNPNRMRNPRLHGLLVSLWGPFSNILLAVVIGLVMRAVPGLPPLLRILLWMGMLMNLALAFFNLLPLPPLDGSHIITYLLPPRAANQYLRFMGQYGMILIILIVLMGQGILGNFVGGSARAVAERLAGGPVF